MISLGSFSLRVHSEGGGSLFHSGGVVHLDILCHTSRFSWIIAYICWALATYWHTSMADRYDINHISQRPFVSILFRTCHCELPSRSISRVKLLLVVVVIVCRLWEQLLRVWPLCTIGLSLLFLLWNHNFWWSFTLDRPTILSMLTLKHFGLSNNLLVANP